MQHVCSLGSDWQSAQYMCMAGLRPAHSPFDQGPVGASSAAESILRAAAAGDVDRGSWNELRSLLRSPAPKLFVAIYRDPESVSGVDDSASRLLAALRAVTSNFRLMVLGLTTDPGADLHHTVERGARGCSADIVRVTINGRGLAPYVADIIHSMYEYET